MIGFSVLCGIVSAISILFGDNGIVEIVFIMLCGFFAWLGDKWKGTVIVASSGLAGSIVAAFATGMPDDPAGILYPAAIILTAFSALIPIGMIGLLTGYLFSFACGREQCKNRHIIPLRVLAGFGSFMIIVCSMEFTMALTGDPIMYWRAKIAADTYIDMNQPDKDFIFDSNTYDYIGESYNCCYHNRNNLDCCLYCTPDNNFPVLRYFSGFTIEYRIKSSDGFYELKE